MLRLLFSVCLFLLVRVEEARVVYPRSGPCPVIPGEMLNNSQFTGLWYPSYAAVPKHLEHDSVTVCVLSDWISLENNAFLFNISSNIPELPQLGAVVSIVTSTPIEGEPGTYSLTPAATPFDAGDWTPYLFAPIQRNTVLAADSDSHVVSLCCYSDGSNHEMMGFIDSREKTLPDDVVTSANQLLRDHGVEEELKHAGTSIC